jgi:hypothetical protein
MSSSSRSRTAERLRRTAAPFALGTALVLPAAANTAVPAPVATDIADARLSGSGRFSWFGLPVYDAALYAGGELDADEPSAQPFVLELRYARSLRGAAIAEASRDEMARLGAGTDAQRVAWHREMTRLFPDVARGQRLAGVNLPGRGARFYLDGRFIGAIADPDFARAFFAIWLDARTQAPALREALLAGAGAEPARR